MKTFTKRQHALTPDSLMPCCLVIPLFSHQNTNQSSDLSAALDLLLSELVRHASRYIKGQILVNWLTAYLLGICRRGDLWMTGPAKHQQPPGQPIVIKLQ